MPIFQTKITRATLTLSPFSSEQMAGIGQAVITKTSDRISQGLDVTDSPAPPLKESYAKRKILHNRAPLRDWNFSGITMKSLKVKNANENKVTIGFITEKADQIVTAQNRRSKQWGLSPSDEKALHEAVRQTLLQQKSTVRWVKKSA